MRPSEARVYIIERDPELLTQLTDFVNATGGEVVGTADGSKFNMDIAGHFPTDAGNPNVVLIDGVRNRDRGPDERESDNGDHYFDMGYRHGCMHRADMTDGLGAVAIGYDPFPMTFDNVPGGDLIPSSAEFATGADLGPIDDQEAAAIRWAALLDPHPAEPVYLESPHDEALFLGPHRIYRTQWDRCTLGQIVNAVTHPGGKLFAEPLSMDVKIHTLSTTESEDEGADGLALDAAATMEPTSCDLQDFIKLAVELQALGDNGKVLADSRSVQAIIEANGSIFVINSMIHRSQYRQSIETKSDKIALEAIAELPDAYWESVGMKPPLSLL